MIVWNCNKVNSYISDLKHLPRLPNRSKRPKLWDILIFETPGTSRSIEKCQGYYLWLPNIEGNWKEYTTRHPPEPFLHPPTPQDTLRYPQTLRYHPWHCHMHPQTLTSIPDTQKTWSAALISSSVLPDIPWQPQCLSECLTSILE